MDKFKSAAKKAAASAPSDVTTILSSKQREPPSEESTFRLPSGIQKKPNEFEEEFDRFMSELVDKGLISTHQEAETKEQEMESEQIVLEEVEGMRDWREVLDSASQRKYYWNCQTNEVLWEKPQFPDQSNDQTVFGKEEVLKLIREKIMEEIRRLEEMKCPEGDMEQMKGMWTKITQTLLDNVNTSVCQSFPKEFHKQLSEILQQLSSLFLHLADNP